MHTYLVIAAVAFVALWLAWVNRADPTARSGCVALGFTATLIVVAIFRGHFA